MSGRFWMWVGGLFSDDARVALELCANRRNLFPAQACQDGSCMSLLWYPYQMLSFSANDILRPSGSCPQLIGVCFADLNMQVWG